MSSVVQAGFLPKTKFSREEATEWVREHFNFKKIDETKNSWRFRQLSPETLRKKGYSKYVVKVLPNGVELALALKD